MEAGFTRVVDIYDLLELEDQPPHRLRTTAMRANRLVPPLKALLTTFSDGTYFFCVK